MDVVRIGIAVKSGVSPVCATCKKYWEGRERGLPDPRCTARKPCGSPLAGLTFPEYEGPITDFTMWCFVCAARATKGIRVGANLRVIGACDEHVKWIGQVEPTELPLNGTHIDILDAVKGAMSHQQFVGPPKKSLVDAMVADEQQWAEDAEKKRRR